MQARRYVASAAPAGVSSEYAPQCWYVASAAPRPRICAPVLLHRVSGATGSGYAPGCWYVPSRASRRGWGPRAPLESCSICPRRSLADHQEPRASCLPVVGVLSRGTAAGGWSGDPDRREDRGRGTAAGSRGGAPGPCGHMGLRAAGSPLPHRARRFARRNARDRSLDGIRERGRMRATAAANGRRAAPVRAWHDPPRLLPNDPPACRIP
jgi:hypothetical protein